MDITTVSQLIGSLGFPIVVAGYLLFKSERTMKENSELLIELTNLIKAMSDKMDKE